MNEKRLGDLLITNRLRPSKYPKQSIGEEAESDTHRVLFSSAFRVMHRKAQVFALEQNASVRTRLTHSLEVAQVGQQIAQAILDIAREKKCIDAWGMEDRETAFLAFAGNACLLHDIGNPPFGHFGETAIKHWFDEQQEELVKKHFSDADKATVQTPFKNCYMDFLRFDGNPQGFRLAAKLQWLRDPKGLNLTTTQLASMIKYPVLPYPEPKYKKAGVFFSEQEEVRSVWESLGMQQNGGNRHPCALVMDAADDIAYCLGDLEDAVERGVLDEDWLFQHLDNELSRNKELREFYVPFSDFANDRKMCPVEVDVGLGCIVEVGRSQLAHLKEFRFRATELLTRRAAESFVNNYDKIVAFEYKGKLIEESADSKAFLSIVKSIAHKYIYVSDVVLRNEVAGYNAITGILDRYKRVLLLKVQQIHGVLEEVGALSFVARGLEQCRLAHKKNENNTDRALTVEKALMVQIPIPLWNVYVAAVCSDQPSILVVQSRELFHRIHLVVDYVSSLTDQAALDTFRLLSGDGAFR